MSRIEAQYSSPNHSDRMGHAIRLIVLHATVGSFHSSLSWLCNPSSRVSAHYLISKTGRVLRLVSEDRAAWYAGASRWFDLGSEDIQRESIGIELENLEGMKLPGGGVHGPDPYPDAQLHALVDLCRPMVEHYRIPKDMFVRHLDIATPRGRKTDPAGLPWDAVKTAVYAPIVAPPPQPPAVTRWMLIAPCVPLTARTPTAPLAAGVVFKPGDVVNVGDATGGWLWVSDRLDTEPGIGFIPMAYAEPI